MSQRDFSEVEPEGTSELPAASRALFLEKVRQSNAACQSGDFATAVSLYTDALSLDPGNHILYSNRSAARLKQGHFSLALQDATRARELCPTWPKAYYRQGVALQCLGRHGEALAAFSAGLAQEPGSRQLLAGLVEASVKSPLRTTLEPTFQQLEAMKLDQSPFVVISVVGQELLGAAHYHAAVTVLESALRIGSCSLKLRGSVFSALSSAHWALSQLDKAIGYMQQDLAVAKSLGDTAGECRAHGNLGSAYFSQGSYKEALTAHRYQLVLAMKCKDTQAAAAALTSLGHVYTAIGDYPNALASHKQCVQLVKQMGDRLQEAREIGNVGAVYLAMGEFDSAVDCHTQHLRLAKRLGNQVEEARAYSNLGSSHHYRRNFSQAIAFHEHVLRIAQALGDRAVEARAYAGLGHAARCSGDYGQAKRWHERQLDMALAARDKVGEGRACSNLGIVYQLLGEHDAALKLHQAHLTIARNLQVMDRAGMGRAYGNIGNAYSAAGFYEPAIKYHKQELTISKEVHDRPSEASTHGNLAVAYQALGAHDMALMHYRAHLGIARELKDTAGEACALLNLGNCLSSRAEFPQAVPFYEQYLMLSQELGDVAAEGKACHFLGYAHYCIGNYREAVRYYDQDLALAKDLQDKMNMGRAYCNLGLAHLALGQLDTALECQKYFLAIAHMTQHLPGKFRALGNIGDVLIKMGDVDEAIKMYHRQLGFARQARERSLEAAACGALGLANRLLRRFDKALGYHTQELTLRQEMADLSGECRAHGHLGAVHMSLGNYTHAVKCYQEQLERAQELQDCGVEAQAFGNLGIARLNMGHYEDAIGYLEQQLGTLEQLSSPTSQLDRARAFGSLGDCYDALGDHEEALKCHDQHLILALKIKTYRDQERAYRGLGHSHRSLGNLQQALVCLEKRLVVSHELGSPEAKGAAYGDLGAIHSTLGNLEQAVSCLEHQRDIARELNDYMAESDAVSGLGAVHQLLGDLPVALRLHQADLERVTELGLNSLQGRACGNLGSVYESLGNFTEAVRYLEQHLTISMSTGDKLGKAQACSSLGRVLLAMGNSQQAVGYLAQGLAIAEALGKREEEARIRHRLGLSLWQGGDLDGAQLHLSVACSLLEVLRRDTRSPAEHRLALYELQTTCYQALQRVLIALGRHEDALVIAEQGRTRALVDLLIERQGHADSLRQTRVSASSRIEECSSTTIGNLLEIVNRQKASVLYYSLTSTTLYAWLLVPSKGVVRFHEASLMQEGPGDEQKGSLLEQYIMSVRDSLGIELLSNARENRDTEDTWGAHLEDMTSERAGFLRMINRNHLLNSSNYSLSSLFSLGSVGGSVASLQGSTRSSASLQGSTRSRRAPQPSWQGPACLKPLYSMLIAPFEDVLPSACGVNNSLAHGNKSCSGRRELILVLDGDLYLVPFPVLRGSPEGGQSPGAEYLSERFSLLAVPTLGSLRGSKGVKVKSEAKDGVSALVVGSPRLPAAVTDQWGWGDIPAALQEAAMVAEMMHCKALVGSQATKEAVLTQLCAAECVHLAAHVSWKLSAIILSPGDVLEGSQGGTSHSSSKQMFSSVDGLGCLSGLTGLGGIGECEEEGGEMSASNLEPCIPPLSDFLLSASDLVGLKLQARLVVLSAAPSRDPQGWGLGAPGSGLVGLVGALLAAGAQAVLVSLWPVPDTATRILLKAFYSAMLQGSRAARALAEAMQTVQHTKHFAHPANWAGFLLVGSNVRLSNKVALMGQALCELLRTPEKCRDALRVSLHLVEKSLQRIHRGQKNAMYTTQKSIENKVGVVGGWKELLMAVGFRFEPAANGIPSSVFFPQSDPEDRLTQCSASLQALLGLTTTSLVALSKLITSVEVAEDIIGVVRAVIAQFSLKNIETESIEIALSVRLWRVAGCHELLASLGFDLMEVGQDDVTLRTGKQANRRHVQFVLQALLALFDTQEAPRSLSLDSSSSLESLASDDNETTASCNLQRSTSSPNLAQSSTMALPPPPLPFTRPALLPGGRLTSGGAFTSYVRRRGEPDGQTKNPTDTRTLPSNITSNHVNSNSLGATTDSDLSDNGGYNINVNLNTTSVSLSRATTSHNLSKFGLQRPPIKVSRPGGGGESDAAFTPSPPAQNMEPIPNSNVTLALAHQTRIRSLYHTNMNHNVQLDNESVVSKALRPDSSSSASSATDWESSGHATVLRRTSHSSHQMPPLPPPRQAIHGANGPLVEALHPLPPVYNNLSSLGGAFESTSSDSDFERNFDQRSNKPLYKTNVAQRKITQAPIVAIDRLSVRTEVSPMIVRTDLNNRKQLALPSEDLLTTSSNLYFSPSDQGSSETNTTNVGDKNKDIKAKKESVGASSNIIQDTILASQLRHINRELTPTISEVYHERSIGLGLAPPLSKLLLNNQSLSVKTAEHIITGLEKIKLNILEESVQEKEVLRCEMCKRALEGSASCTCSKKKTVAKPWLSGTSLNESIVKGSDLTTADILERQNKIKMANSEILSTYSNKALEYELRNADTEPSEAQPRTMSPFSELSRRDEGDGRSVADSQCSSNYKLLVNSNLNRQATYAVNSNTEPSKDSHLTDKNSIKNKNKIISAQQRKKYSIIE